MTSRGVRCRGCDSMLVGFRITYAMNDTKVESSNPAHGEVYSIQHYMIKFVRSVIFSGYSVSSINKTDCHDIAEILLKVSLNTITLTPGRASRYVLSIRRSCYKLCFMSK